MYNLIHIHKTLRTGIISLLKREGLSTLQLAGSGIIRCNILSRYGNHVYNELDTNRLESDANEYAVDLSVLNTARVLFQETLKVPDVKAMYIQFVYQRGYLSFCHLCLTQ